VLVYGDTNSTLAGALAAKKLHIKLAHVEAGLRSFNMQMPEEINRILTDRISDILFCPTDTAIANLKNEGYDNIDCKIVKSGDVMYDAAMFYAKLSKEKSTIIKKLNIQNYVLCTLHRAENTDDINNLKSILAALNKISEKQEIILPIHPRTRKIIENNNLKVNFQLIDPVGYFDMIELLKNCAIVMTDSGGLQKEAFFFEKNCVTIRDQTEWVELVNHNFNILTGADENKILKAYDVMLHRKNDFNINLYGSADAGLQIINEILK
jgi:UDP-GlcNAc3NAcA epimerase